LNSCMGKQDVPTTENDSKNNSGTVVIKEWDTVLIHYIWTLEDGSQFDNSYDRWSPFEFVVWEENIIPWFSKWVLWMKAWEKKSITIPPEDAYGLRDESNTLTLPKEQFKDFEDNWIVLETGAILPTAMWDLEILWADETTITIDGNNPMAGKTLNFELEVVEIK
jgi:FKBP-type peptidyl-prolyl cis-trans isomerase 2